MIEIRIYIQDRYIKSNDFSPDMLLTYLALRKIILRNANEYYVSIGLLTYVLFGKQVASQLITNSFMKGLNKLIDKQYVIHVDKDKKFKKRANEYILNLSKLQINKVNNKNTDYYTPIELDYIVKIMESNLKVKFLLLRFYCYLMTTIIKSGANIGVGFTSYEDMASDIGIGRQTISKYMDYLVDLNIIYVYKSNDAITIDGKIKEIPNVYGDIRYKDKIVNIGKIHENNFGVNAKKIKSARSSATRSASAKYNIILNDMKTSGKIRYGISELKDIYNILKKYNKRYNLTEKDEKYKDLSIFSAYDFYNKD